jgi:predicted PurR-regulated permease PerM
VTAGRQTAWWAAILIGFVLSVYLLRDMLLPFVVGMGVAYLFDPLADRLERIGLNRTMATTVITCFAFVLFLVILVVLVPMIVEQSAALLNQMPEYANRAAEMMRTLVYDIQQAAELRGVEVSEAEKEDAIRRYAEQAIDFFGQLAGNMLRGGVAVLNFVSLLVITPVVAFYLLLDWDRMVAAIGRWLPREHADEIKTVAREIDRTLAGFIRGQGTVCITLVIYYAVLLELTGLNFGFLIGLFSGLLSFIPFVGAIFGAVASIGLAVVQFGFEGIWLIVAVAVIYVVGQLLEAYVLTPKLVGNKVGLHPVWVMFGVLAGGVLFGFVGMLLALPVSAVIGVLARHGLQRYMASRLYDPENPV